MKIFYAISDACCVKGGAERAASIMLRHLKDHYGFDCEMLSAHPIQFDEIRDGIRLRGFRDLEELNAIFCAERPDVVIGSLADAIPAFRLAERCGVPRILSVHGFEYSPPDADERLQWAMHPGFLPLPEEDRDFVIRSADHAFSCSTFMQKFLRERIQLESVVLQNDWDIEEVLINEAPQKPEYITGICASPNKGVEIFLELARRFPGEQFMLAGTPGTDFPPKLVEDAVACGNIELPGHLPPRDFLSASKLILVPSQWPEPFGRIAVEAMINKIPVIASRTGGLGDIIFDSPLGIDEFTDIDIWEARLHAQLAGRVASSEDLEQAHKSAHKLMGAEPVHVLAKAINSLCENSKPTWDERSIAFVGGLDAMESNTIVNGHWERELTRRGYSVTDSEDTHIAAADNVIIHDYSKDFEEFVPPETGHYIAVRTSDFGPYPKNWADKIEAEFDQLWVYTEWIAEQARATGIDPEMIKLVPLGVDPKLHRPDGPASTVVPADTFTFLFVGGAVLRKGIDTLIGAYQSAFSSDDDVALIIKGNSQNLHYQGFNEVEEILDASEAKSPPKIIHIDAHLDSEELAAMFRSCDVGVFPYRAEGFALPIAEAMASGTPSIVPNFGACLDFCNEDTSFMLPARRIKIPFPRKFSLAAGFVMDVQSVDFCEIKMADLAQAMRAAFDAGRPALEQKRQAGLQLIRERLNWANSVDHIEACLGELAAKTPRRVAAAREAAARKYRREKALREMSVEKAMSQMRKPGAFEAEV